MRRTTADRSTRDFHLTQAGSNRACAPIPDHRSRDAAIWLLEVHAACVQKSTSSISQLSHSQIHVSAIRDERTTTQAFREGPLAKAAGLLLVSRHEAKVPTDSKSPAETASRSIFRSHHPVISYYTHLFRFSHRPDEYARVRTSARQAS